MTEKKPAFHTAVRQLMKDFSITTDEALQRVQERYGQFHQRNERLLERQNDASNKAGVDLNTQSILIATATLTFSSAFVGVLYDKLTSVHVLIFFGIALLSLVSIAFALVDHMLAVSFHKKWARVYHEIAQESAEKLEDGRLQNLSDLNSIEDKHIDSMSAQTATWIPWVTVICVILGLALLALAYFIDMPGYSEG